MIEEIRKFLEDHSYSEKNLNPKPKKPCIMIYEGKRVRLGSGKEVWPSKGAARTAFSNAINTKFSYIDCKKVREKLEGEGVLVFKEL